MPRRPREEVAGGIHHVYARGNDRGLVFFDDDDRREYLALLEHVSRAQRWLILSYCLMDNHLHLMIETPEPNLGAGMKRLHGDFAQELNRRRGRVGHLFQGRFGSKLQRTEPQLWTTAAYIAANPVEAGLCATAQDWRWGSHATASTGESGPAWLHSGRLFGLFTPLGGDPQERYCAMVQDRCAERARVARRAAHGSAGI